MTRITRCRECGTEVKTTARGGSVLCEDCRREMQRLYNEKRLRRRKKIILKDTLIVIKDPDPLGGFPPGAQLLKEEAKCMCRDNHKSFTPGTLLKDYRGKIFEVIEIPRGQKLIEVPS